LRPSGWQLALLEISAELCHTLLDFPKDAPLTRMLQVFDLLFEIILIARKLGRQV